MKHPSGLHRLSHSVSSRTWIVLAILLFFVLVDSLNHGTVGQLLAGRHFPPDMERKLLGTSRNLIVHAVIAAAAGILVLGALPGLRKPHRAFLLCIGLLGPLYVFLLTPFSVPDEQFHYQQSLARAASWTRVERLDKDYLLPGMPGHANSVQGYLFARRVFRGDTPSGGGFEVSTLRVRGHALLHLPQTVGLCLGLAAGLPPAPSFYLGRLSALLFYLVAVAAAIWLTPVLKECLAVAALCPIALQQACSYSYDSETLACSFLVFGVAMRLACGTGEPLSRKTLAAAIAATVLGMAMKCAAVPFLPLFCAIPASRFRSGVSGKIRFLSILCLVAALAVPLSASVAPHAVRDLPLGTMYDGRMAWTFGELFLHPVRFCHILANTADASWIRLFYESFGYRMSGLSLTLPSLYPLAFVLLLAATARLGGNALARPVGAAAALGVLILTAYLIVIMLLTWTAMGTVKVEGLQGRYWTPVLPLLACAVFARAAIPGEDACRASRDGEGDLRVLAFPCLLLLHVPVVVSIVKQTLARGA